MDANPPNPSPPPPLSVSSKYPFVCAACERHGVVRNVGRIPATNTPAVKRRQRAAKVAFVARCGLPVERIAVVIVDHPLPVSDPDAGDHDGPTSLFAEDLCAGVPGLRPHQIFSANVDPTVVAALHAAGFANAARMCLCLYLETYAQPLRRLHGGAVLLDADVWGAYEWGARPPLAVAVQHGLLNVDPAGGGALVCFACSDLPQRMTRGGGRPPVDTGVDIADDAIDLLGGDGAYRCRRYKWPAGVTVGYGQTMQNHGFTVVARAAAAVSRAASPARDADADRSQPAAKRSKSDPRQEQHPPAVHNDQTNKTTDCGILPYQGDQLRCDPAWSQVADPSACHAALRIGSHERVEFRCSECGAIYAARVNNHRVATGRCGPHAAKLHRIQRPKYAGAVPPSLRRPLRAAVLQGLSRTDAVSLVQSLLSEGMDSDAAHRYVAEVYDGGYTRVQLLDSTFWGEDTYHRKDGKVYHKKPSKLIVTHSEVGETYM